MKKLSLLNLLTTIVVAMSCFVFSACGDDNDGFEQTENVSDRDPEGTVVVNMNNGSRDNYIGMGLVYDIHIDEANNFVGESHRVDFVSVGKVSGLSKIKTIPTSGWSSSAAVVPGTGYVARYNNRYARLYVVDYIVGKTGGIIGAVVKYQSPFEVNEETDEKPVDYTATTSVKKATISNSGITFYEDYNAKCTLSLIAGEICLTHYLRFNGEWTSRTENHGGVGDELQAGMKSIGECSSISSITVKATWGEGYGYGFNRNYHALFQPKCGYACCFKTGTGQAKYMRIYPESYTLDGSGSLSTITIQYQLY